MSLALMTGHIAHLVAGNNPFQKYTQPVIYVEYIIRLLGDNDI